MKLAVDLDAGTKLPGGARIDVSSHSTGRLTEREVPAKK
jgi:hypothetical protein